MCRILFFAYRGVMPGTQQIAQSTVVRVINIAKKLKSFGYECVINFIDVPSFKYNIQAVKRADVVFVHKIQTNRFAIIEPTFLPLFMAGRLSNKLIFDFDDAIFLTFPGLFEMVVHESDLVFAGSHLLYGYASKFNNKTHLIPSAVRTDVFKPLNSLRDKNTVVIGWHGSVANQLNNLKMLTPVLRSLTRYDIIFKLLGTKGNKNIQNFFRKQLPNIKVEFGLDEWVPYEQVPLLLANVDIGVSPLKDNIWNRGKCAMKLLEYMALGLPVVASNVGEHSYIIRNGYNGFLASSTEEWVKFLSMLIEDTSLRREMGTNARKFIEKHNSLDMISLKIKNSIEEILQEV